MGTTLVTGASGKVGWWGVQALAEAGHQILAVDRVTPRAHPPKGGKFWDADLSGHSVFSLSVADSWVDAPVELILAQTAWSVERPGGFGGSDTGWDISKARELLGCDPQHSWRQHL